MYVETGDYDIAIRWYDRAEPFVASEVERQALRREKQKASFLKELQEESEGSPNKATTDVRQTSNEMDRER
jgi:hypothetical protein